MAREPEEEELDDEGGPVKSFLEHLEDLRWVLIKSSAVVFVAMVICLIAGDRVVAWIKRPLEKAQVRYRKEDYVAVVMLGTNRLTTLHLDNAQRETLKLDSNHFATVHVDFKSSTNGTNLDLSLWMESGKQAEALARQMKVDLNTLGPAGGFMVAFQVAFYGGLGAASPFILYFVAQFVFPALKLTEKKYVYRGILYAVPLFISGVCFCYFALMPIALAASQAYSQWLGLSANIWRAEEYISFVCKFMLGMGLGFELPVVLLVLVKIGILDYQSLSKMRRYMIVINLVLGALLTTPEVLTQVLMAVPLQILYEISVWIAWYWEWRDKRREKAAGRDTEAT
jgi:sec-independent protein translocase protein TatC